MDLAINSQSYSNIWQSFYRCLHCYRHNFKVCKQFKPGSCKKANKYYVAFVVEGIVDQAVDSLGLVTEPQIPYMVLHDPPGDGSFTALDQAKTICRSLETSFANDESNNTNASLKLGYAGSVGVIVVVDIEVYVEFSGSLRLAISKCNPNPMKRVLPWARPFQPQPTMALRMAAICL